MLLGSLCSCLFRYLGFLDVHTTTWCPLSGTTRVSQYQKKHLPTDTHSDHQQSFINFLHLLQSIASCLAVIFHNLCPGPLWSTLYLLLWSPLLLTPYISSLPVPQFVWIRDLLQRSNIGFCGLWVMFLCCSVAFWSLAVTWREIWLYLLIFFPFYVYKPKRFWGFLLLDIVLPICRCRTCSMLASLQLLFTVLTPTGCSKCMVQQVSSNSLFCW